MGGREDEGLVHESPRISRKRRQIEGSAGSQHLVEGTGVGAECYVDVLGQARPSVKEHRLAADEHREVRKLRTVGGVH